MIKFFRNIRKNLLKEGKTTKYFKYAIGEIVLVVIGILIALQINNWHEINKTKRLERKIITELQNNLRLDLKEIQADVNYMNDINQACSRLKNYLQYQEIPNDSFYKEASILRVTPHFDPNKSGYGLLESKGVEVISNDSLRNAISLLYERSYPYYKRYEEERLRFHALHSEPKLLEYFNMEFTPTKKHYGNFHISIADYEKLLKDSAFEKLLSAIAFENSAVQNRGQKTEAAIISLLHFLQEELEDEN